MAESITTKEKIEQDETSKASVSRKEKRKSAKKDKRKQIRKELAEKARAEEEARLNDPEEQKRIQLEEERENERLERERREFEEREKLFLEELARKKAEEEEQERRNAAEEEESKRNQAGAEKGSNEDDEWEYVEEGPPEIIWQGNEIIVKKKKVRVRKKDANQNVEKVDPNRPTSNPLPPQSEAYAAYINAPVASAQELLENVAQQVPNFGTEQDKAHCPFHIKTGACRFGSRCNRVHFYPDKSCTLLSKNMYNGPGLSWEQDEGLEYTDEEVERCYEEFYEDVHTEFLKFGEIVNFKVCRNGSFHLRGNVYIHYKSLDSAVQAYHSVNGRYFAGKQVTCEFVSLTKWKIAICGEYMKSRLKTCSRGTACNFLHCFGNPGGDYEWANSDKPPPRYWVKNMSALFGYSDESWYNKQIEQQSPRERRNCSRILTSEEDRYYSKRYRSMGTDQLNGNYHRSEYKEDDVRHSRFQERHISDGRKRQKSLDEKYYEEETNYKSHHCGNDRTDDADSDRDWSDRERDGDRQHRHHGGVSKSSRQDMESRDYDRASRRTTHGSGSDEDSVKRERETDRDRQQRRTRKRSRHRKKVSELSDDDQGESNDAKLEQQRVQIHGHSSKFHQRIKSHETDSRYNYDDVGHRDSENEPLPKKQKRSSRKFPVDENVVSYGSHQHEGRSKSRDNGYFPDDGNGERNRWEPDKNIPEKHHHRSRRKLSGDDSEQQSVRYKSDDHNSDELSAVSRVRVRRSSSREKHLDSLGELDSTEELKQFEDSNKKNQDKQNSRDHNHKYKRRAKKTRI